MSAAILVGEPPAMTYLVAADLPSTPAGERFRALLARPGIVQLPGAHNGQAALQAKAAGFEGLYLSGAAMTASMGLPDLGVITVDEVCFFIRQIARSSGLPLLADGDTGYGEALNVMHMVRSFEDAGAAAVHIEDQLLPKKCGHLNDKKLADARDMAAKIAAARRARRHLFIVARTDAAASEGIDGAVARAKLYLDAGADAITVAGEANMAKLLAADVLFDAADHAMQTLGAAAWDEREGMLDLFLDARAARSAPISQELALNFIAQHVLGLPSHR